jgi:hypothetical protein
MMPGSSRNASRGAFLRRSLLAALLAFSGWQPTSAQTAAGTGTRPCSAFTAALAVDENAAIDSYVAWSQGFISGFNWSNVRERNVRIDATGIISWLGAFCTANPEHRIYNALQELIQLEAR